MGLDKEMKCISVKEYNKLVDKARKYDRFVEKLKHQKKTDSNFFEKLFYEYLGW